MKEIDIFTDCSGSTDELGISFVIFDEEDEQSFKFSSNVKLLNNEFVTHNDMCSVLIGECYAVFKALSHIKNQQNTIARIYTDNEHVFRLLNNQSIIRKKKNDLIKIVRRTKRMKNNDIDIRWIKGHVGVYGNEMADKLAKNGRRKKTREHTSI